MERTTRYSKKRADILAAIRGTDCHPSAEWVYQTLKPNHPDLSLGTVYRNLVFFQERGDIRSVGVIKGQERFDGITTPHSHFICRHCGAVMDLSRTELASRIDRDVSEQYGLMVEHHELTFHGLCPTCIHNQKHEEDVLS
ncbi:Fur family transcriptional regulator [Pseudoflavonifractor phocaeensis]|uniref:Fur family transcriptional regulator n=1 Tax=Pseudoflavonifractor phocaeensis TaxID=1870988 RepID=UPI001F1ED8E5|nr:transcriptional repressor [Pseudoflavonifractor phocaeensis]MCF2662931.1 transcriptional repressor [Pseudoflavonifractor phocaeensis]